MTATPIIEIDGLVKDYPIGSHVVHALRGVSLHVNGGDSVAIMGPSGSGKSTVLNVMGCLDRATAGRYRLDGRDVSGLGDDELSRVRNRKIGFVFQNFNLLARHTALENVALPLMYAGVPTHERHERARATLAMVGLGNRVDHLPAQMSGGQQQRVALARALVNDPVLVLADEPTGNLDTRTSLEVMAELQALNRRGITAVIVTHEEDIARFARRVLRFRDGRIERDEAVDDPLDARALLGAATAVAAA